MRESLGARLVIWHTAIVAAVIVVFAGAVCYLVWRTKLANVDAALAARATALSSALRPVAPGTFDLTLTPPLAGDRASYHALWTREGAFIDRSDETLVIPLPKDA